LVSIEHGTVKGTAMMARRFALFCVSWLLFALAPLHADPVASAVETITPASVVFDLKIPDVPVVDQDGRKLNFYADLVKGRTVAINFIFTTCTTICPQLTMAMRRTQQELAARVGRDVWLVSVSVDPTTDVPERLRRFAARFDVGPGWTFVTGRKTDIDRLLSALGNSGSGSDHATTVLIGNEPAGHWVRSSGLAPVSTNVKLIIDAAAARPSTRF
jgi:cytochrome oxidase Cu insertion factor (SCO1/SenC/PrrC family)